MDKKPQRNWDWNNALMLVILIYTAGARLTATDWLTKLNYVETLAVLGTILGLALGASQFRRKGISWLVAGYSLVVVIPILSNIIEGEEDPLLRLGSFGARALVTLQQLFSGVEIQDPLFFISMMGILFWTIGIVSGFKMVRKASFLWIAILPTLPILIIQYYDGSNLRRLWILAFYFLILLFLLGRVTLRQNREKWEKDRVFTGTEPDFDLNNSIFLAATIIIMVAWLFPTPAAAIPAAARWWRDTTKPLENTRERLDEILASLRRGVLLREQYGPVMALGRNAAIGDEVLFTVTPPNALGLPSRYYWHARTYDIYQNGSWQASSSISKEFSPQDPLLSIVFLKDTRTEEFIFNWQGTPQSLLVLPPQNVWASRAGFIQFGDVPEAQIDPFSQYASPMLQTGDRYTARAAILNPTLLDLQQAGDEYPTWIKERYLKLPENIASQITNLSNEITRGQETPYDKTVAITNYLRNEIKYSETVPAPPPGIDPLMWFLFSWKSGYCNYYASAEVLLLRAAGIPARMVVGYAQGALTSGNYAVRQKDAHAWPEVYFPQVGWVEFEPTVAQPNIIRPTGLEAEPRENDEITLTDEERRGGLEGVIPDPIEPSTTATSNALSRIPVRAIIQWIIMSTAFAAIVYWGWRLNREYPLFNRIPRALQALYQARKRETPRWLQHWLRWTDLTSIERSYHAINQCLGWLRNPQSPSTTAVERARVLMDLLPEASEEIHVLLEELSNTLFSPQPGDPVRAGQASWRIRYLTGRHIIRTYLFGAA